MPAVKLTDLVLVKGGKRPDGTSIPARKMTREARILALVAQGITYKAAAAAADVGESTFYDWCNKGKKATRGPYHKFWQALQQAKLKAQAVAEAQLAKHGETNWRACAYRLKVLDPETYADKPARLEVSGPEGGPVQVDIATLAAGAAHLSPDLTVDQLRAAAWAEGDEDRREAPSLPPARPMRQLTTANVIDAEED